MFLVFKTGVKIIQTTGYNYTLCRYVIRAEQHAQVHLIYTLDWPEREQVYRQELPVLEYILCFRGTI